MNGHVSVPPETPGKSGQGKKASAKKRRMAGISVGVLLLIAITGYFVGQSLIRNKFEAALDGLPSAFRVSYSSLDPGLLTGSLVIKNFRVRLTPGPDTSQSHSAVIDRIVIQGISYWAFLTSHTLHVRAIRLDGVVIQLNDYLLNKKVTFPKIGSASKSPPFTEASIDQFEITDLKAVAYKGVKEETNEEIEEEFHKKGETVYLNGSLDIHSIHVNDINQPINSKNLQFGDVKFMAKDIRYIIPGALQKIRLYNFALNSKDSSLLIDTVRVYPTVKKEDVGKIKGEQEDVVDGISEGINVSGLRFTALLRHHFTAGKVTIKKSNFHVFRDRRLKRNEEEKTMPVDFLKSLPIDVRVQSVHFGSTNFSYEEFPGKGDESGTLKIVGLSGTLTPLVNHPLEGDPAYLTLTSEGSLMGSGTVSANTRMPLRKGDPYIVNGAFHELDVTSLNQPAGNLGLIHLKSGVLNLLAFQFAMTDEKSTGKIIGEYHNLVVQKLKDKHDEKKVDKMKSFALKEFIIPLNKDKSLPETQRTGKVDYKRDRTRMFSYYLLHSLLVGVKGSFKLGFLLPG